MFSKSFLQARNGNPQAPLVRGLGVAAASRLSRLLLLSLMITLPAWAQKDLEDAPIADVVPTPIKAATPKPTAKATISPTATAKSAATAKPTAITSIEDAPIADAPTAPLSTATKQRVTPKAKAAPKELPLPTDPTPAPVSHSAILARHSGSETEFDAPGVARDGWFDLARTFRIDFIRQALWAGLLVAMMCSFLGVYVVLKRIVFVGVALAELSSAGIAVGLWLGFSPIWGAMLLMLFGVTMFAIRWSPRRVPTESVIGIVYSVAGALAILCIAKSAQGETHMLKLLQGDVLTVAPSETLEMLGIFSVVAIIHTLFGKEFLLVSFDRDAASTMGYNAVRWDFLLYLTIGVVISFSIRATGVLMATTMLIIPGVTALLLAQRIRWVWPTALLFGVLPVVFGLHLSLLLDLPASAVIVALSFLLLLPVLVFSSSRRS